MKKGLKLISVLLLSLSMSMTLLIPVIADEVTPGNKTNNVHVQGDYVIYDENGEVTQFFIPQDPLVQSRAITLLGIAKFAYGVCKITSQQTGYNPCSEVAKYLGLQLSNGFYMMQNTKYSGEWKVQYGYINGCQPQHLGGCFGATYTRIG